MAALDSAKGAREVLSEPESLAHASASAAVCLTALCCDHPHALKWREVSEASDKEGMLVGVGSYIGTTEAFCVLGERTTFSPTMSSAVKLLHLARALSECYLVNN